MGIILKARTVLEKKVLLQLCYSFVTPYLIYCLKIWGNAYDIHIQPLITTQKRLLELLIFRHTALIHILFKHLNVLPFKKLLFLWIGLQLFKNEYDQLPAALNMFFLLKYICA